MVEVVFDLIPTMLPAHTDGPGGKPMELVQTAASLPAHRGKPIGGGSSAEFRGKLQWDLQGG
jgi:hypothetical protein